MERARVLGDRELEGRLLNNLGGIYANLGEPGQRFEYLDAALRLRREMGDDFGVAATLNNLGSLHRSLGEVDEAVRHLTEALAMFEVLDNRYWMARTLNNLGYVYLGFGDYERARTLLLRAISIRREVGDKAGEAITLRNLGRTFAALGDEGKALAFFRKALQLGKARNDLRGVVTSRKLLAGLLVPARPDEALAELRAALEDARRMGNRHEQAEILELKARAHLASEGADRLAEATAAAVSALDLHRNVRDPLGEASALTLQARVAILRGERETAQQALNAVLAGLDSVDIRLGEASRRAAFLASQRQVYELYVNLLMDWHRDEPAAGHARRALEISETARSRALLAMLDSGSVDDDELRSAENRLAAKIQLEIDLLGVEHSAGEARRAEEERMEAQAAVEMARGRLRRFGALRPSAVDLPKADASAIQRLAVDGTVIVEIFLGEQRSHGWWIETGKIETFDLPAREEVERLARAAHASLSAPGSPMSGKRLASLGQIVLGPVQDRLRDQRLAWVADGSLHLVPLAALGDPRSPVDVYLPMILRHETASLPSATALGEMRAAGRKLVDTGAELAILADPIFRANDSRLSQRAESREATPTIPVHRPAGIDDLVRLPESRAEAEAIAGLVEEPARLLALDGAARRALVVDGTLDDYRVLHFATHGFIHPNAPELSGLILSRFDGEGRPIDSFLSLHDAARLDLAAELVVLSGCHTALGRQVRGEGFVGLARGFMYAGAPRVIASHWQVRDQATAQLMARFYRALLLEDLPAAKALRAAQLEQQESRRFRDPYYWAAFSLQGDWR